MAEQFLYGPIRVGGDGYMDAHLDNPPKAEKPEPAKCDHPGCWGVCGKCGTAHVHEHEHGRHCPNCGRV